MKRFSDIQKKSKIRRINEAESNLPKNYEEMSKEELVKLMSGQTSGQTTKTEEVTEEEKDEVKETTSEKNGPVKFFSKLFESREMAHVYHLQVKGDMGSHAKHVALQEYYEGDEEGGGVLDSLDTLIEMYQGQFEIIDGYETIDTSSTMSKDPIEYFTELAEFIKSERHNCFDKEDTHYFNLIDDILVLIYRLLYKLKYNK